MSCVLQLLVGVAWSIAWFKSRERVEIVPHRCAGQTDPQAQGPGECPPANREVIALDRGMQVRPATWRRAAWIGAHGRLALGVRADDDS